ncbi:hypothetical protein [Carp edema virus]|nr:hypothetical protein [Carp edema virus]
MDYYALISEGAIRYTNRRSPGIFLDLDTNYGYVRSRNGKYYFSMDPEFKHGVKKINLSSIINFVREQLDRLIDEADHYDIIKIRKLEKRQDPTQVIIDKENCREKIVDLEVELSKLEKINRKFNVYSEYVSRFVKIDIEHKDAIYLRVLSGQDYEYFKSILLDKSRFVEIHNDDYHVHGHIR